jgi:hypothetical protein
MLEKRTKTGKKKKGRKRGKWRSFYAAYFSGQHAVIF